MSTSIKDEKSEIDNSELIKRLNEITKQNFDKLYQEEKITKMEQFTKNFIQNKKIEYSYENSKVPFPLSILFEILCDPEKATKISGEEKFNFDRYLLKLNDDYDITFNQGTYDKESIPELFKLSIDESLNIFNEESKISELKEKLNNMDSYPKIFEYDYLYQHPVKKKIMMGPTKLGVNDKYKIGIISPICFIVEISGHTSGYSMADYFYTNTRYQFNMELNEDLSIKQTLINIYFGCIMLKDTWFKNTIISGSIEGGNEQINDVVLPTFFKEIEMSINDSEANKKPRNFKIEEKENNLEGGDDVILNNSLIYNVEDDDSLCEVSRKNQKKIKFNQGVGEIKSFARKNLFGFIITFICSIFLCYISKFFGKDYILLLAASIILYFLIKIEIRLEQLYNSNSE